MAYYKRNGFTPASGRDHVGLSLTQQSVPQTPDIGFDSVKYVKDVKRVKHGKAGQRSTSGYIKPDKQEYVYVLKCFKNLVGDLLDLSDQAEVDYQELAAIADGFERLVCSQKFCALPRHFPYRSLISELNEKMDALVAIRSQGEIVRFCLSADRKSSLTAVYGELTGY